MFRKILPIKYLIITFFLIALWAFESWFLLLFLPMPIVTVINFFAGMFIGFVIREQAKING